MTEQPSEIDYELIELTAPNLEEAIKLVLDHWVEIFNEYDEPFWLDPKITFENGLERNLCIQFASDVDEGGIFFSIRPIGDFNSFSDEMEEKEAAFKEHGLEGIRPSELPRSFMDKLLNRPRRVHDLYEIGVSTKSFNFGHVTVDEITADVMKLVEAIVDVFPKYFSDHPITMVSVDTSSADANFPESVLPLLKNIDVTISKN